MCGAREGTRPAYIDKYRCAAACKGHGAHEAKYQRGLTDSAAVGIVEKIISFVFLVPSSMLSTVSALCAQNIGAGKHDRASATLRYAMAITLTFGVVVGIIVQFAAEGMVGLFTLDADVMRMGGQYLRGYIWDCALAGIHFCFSGIWPLRNFVPA